MKKTEEIKKIIEHHQVRRYQATANDYLGLLRSLEGIFEEMCEAIKTVCDREEKE